MRLAMVRNLSGWHQPNAGMRSADIWIRKQTSNAQSHSTLSTQVSHWYDLRSRHSARNSTTESHSKTDTYVLNDERFSSSTELPNRLVSLYTVLNLYQPTAIVPTFSIRIMYPRNTTTGQRLPKEIFRPESKSYLISLNGMIYDGDTVRSPTMNIAILKHISRTPPGDNERAC